MNNEGSIITHQNPKSPIAEAYRSLRTNIRFSSVDNPLKSIAVTSFGIGEGKTTTIVNLAVAFSQQGSKVLIIDGDLRKPKIHKIFGMENKNGLTNFLTAHEHYSRYIKHSQIDNLDVLVSGDIPPNPSELLTSYAMKNFTYLIKNDYDIVLIDTSPVGIVTDAAIISTIVDGTILVAASGVVELDSLARASELLNKVNANIIGVVLNRIGKSNSKDYYYHYSYSEDKSSYKKRQKQKNKMRD